MKIILQRVKEAQVHVEGQLIGAIGYGLLVFIAIEAHDDQATHAKMSNKLLNYRVFSDQSGKMNLSLLDIKGDLLLVSQFTLAAKTHKGLRPSFTGAANPEKALAEFNEFVSLCRESPIKVATGQFAADMQVSLVNDGPVTFLLEA